MEDEPIMIGDAEVVDAHVDWHITHANTPTFRLILDGHVGYDGFTPLSEDMLVDDVYVMEHNGVFRSFRPIEHGIGNLRRREVEHENGELIEGAWDYQHNTSKRVNKHIIDSDDKAITVSASSTRYAIRASKMHEIMETFINGTRGSDTVSYWYWYRDVNHKWARATTSRDDYEGYVSPTVVMCEDTIYTYKPVREDDVTDEDTVYTPR